MQNSVTAELKKFIENNEACLVIGSGISKACCPDESVVTWSGLIKKGIDFLKEVDPQRGALHESVFRALTSPTSNTSNYLILGEYLENHINAAGGGFPKWIQSQFKSLHLKDKTLVKAIDDLQLPIITTNYDGILEQATFRSTCTLRNLGDFISEMRRSAHSIRPTVFHVHGYYGDPDTVVFGSSSYERILNNDILQNFERSISVFKALIFIGTGAGLYDPHFEKSARLGSPQSLN